MCDRFDIHVHNFSITHLVRISLTLKVQIRTWIGHTIQGSHSVLYSVQITKDCTRPGHEQGSSLLVTQTMQHESSYMSRVLYSAPLIIWHQRQIASNFNKGIPIYFNAQTTLGTSLVEADNGCHSRRSKGNPQPQASVINYRILSSVCCQPLNHSDRHTIPVSCSSTEVSNQEAKEVTLIDSTCTASHPSSHK